MSAPLTRRDLETLRAVAAFKDTTTSGWGAPMMAGGTDGSHHSATMAKLARKRLLNRRRRNSLANLLGSHRGSWEYQIAPAGAEVLAARSRGRAPRTRGERA